MSESEDWYDREIAPLLLALANKCGDRGMSFLSVVEYEPGRRSRTQRLLESAGLEMTMISHCAMTAPNIDGYMIGLIRYCRERGIDTGSSMFVRLAERTT
jgi:hypothetical protein